MATWISEEPVNIKQTKSTYAYQTDRGPQSEIWEKGIVEEQGLEEYHTV